MNVGGNLELNNQRGTMRTDLYNFLNQSFLFFCIHYCFTE